MGRNLIQFLSYRILQSLLTLFVLISVCFFLLRFLPGGPFDLESALSPSIKAYWETYYGLNQSVFIQYIYYIKNLLVGNLGVSFLNPERTIVDTIKDPLKTSFLVGGLSFLFSILLGIIFGTLVFLFRNKVFQKAVELSSVGALSFPSLMLGPLLIYLFGLKLALFPVALLSTPRAYVLPILALMIRPFGFFTKLTLNKLSEVLTEPYIVTAKAKGLSDYKIILNHALPITILPILANAGSIFAGLVSGSLVVEALFAIPGMGSLFVESIGNRDYPLILALAILYAIILMVTSLVFELITKSLDQRVELE